MAAVVGDADLQACRDGAQADPDRGGGRGVLADVGEGFEDDAVGGGRDVGGEPLLQPVLDEQDDGRPGHGEAFGESADVGEAGDGGGGGRVAVVLAEDLDQAAHRAEGLVPGGLDPAEDLAGAFRGDVGEAGGPCLDDDPGDVVGDEVVEFAGQLQAFGGADGAQVAYALGRLHAQEE